MKKKKNELDKAIEEIRNGQGTLCENFDDFLEKIESSELDKDFEQKERIEI